MITLFMGRHGETELNSDNRLRGWIDEPLNDDGIKEAHAMAEKMEDYPIVRVYCSDLDRADHTAQIVAKQHALKQIPREWFRPLNYGDYNGKKLSDIEAKLCELNKQWATDPMIKAPGGESFAMFQDRNLNGLSAIFSASNDGDEIMIVAHLRNCLLFHAVAVNGGPLSGDKIEAMSGDDWHQKSGEVSRFTWNNGAFKFEEIL